MPLCFYFLNIPEICLDITMVSTCHQRIRSCSYSSPPQSQVTVHRWHAEFLVSTPAEGEMNTTSSWVFPSGIFTTKEMHECQNISFGLKRKVFPLHPQVVFKGIFWKWEEEGPPTLELLDASDWQNLGEEKKKHCAPGLSSSCHRHAKENLQRGYECARRHQADPKKIRTSHNPTPSQCILELSTSKSRFTLQCHQYPQ